MVSTHTRKKHFLQSGFWGGGEAAVRGTCTRQRGSCASDSCTALHRRDLHAWEQATPSRFRPRHHPTSLMRCALLQHVLSTPSYPSPFAPPLRLPFNFGDFISFFRYRTVATAQLVKRIPVSLASALFNLQFAFSMSFSSAALPIKCPTVINPGMTVLFDNTLADSSNVEYVFQAKLIEHKLIPGNVQFCLHPWTQWASPKVMDSLYGLLLALGTPNQAKAFPRLDVRL
jgi:hypothetical protein